MKNIFLLSNPLFCEKYNLYELTDSELLTNINILTNHLQQLDLLSQTYPMAFDFIRRYKFDLETYRGVQKERIMLDDTPSHNEDYYSDQKPAKRLRCG